MAWYLDKQLARTYSVGPWTLIGVPLYTLAEYKGMGDAPSALREAGIVRALGNLEFPALGKDLIERKTKNFPHFKDATSRIYNVAKSVEAENVFILGGECSFVVGALSGLSEVIGGKPGMLWMDAHGDFNTPETSPSGYIGGMCLAMACGRSAGGGLEFGWQGHPLEEERLVLVGSRDFDPPEVAAFNASPAKIYTPQQVKKTGGADVAEEAARHLTIGRTG